MHTALVRLHVEFDFVQAALVAAHIRANGSVAGAVGSPAFPGSPKRVLYSSTWGPSAVSIRPMKSVPRKSIPSAAMASTEGRQISRSMRASRSGVTTSPANKSPCRPCWVRCRCPRRAYGLARWAALGNRDPRRSGGPTSPRRTGSPRSAPGVRFLQKGRLSSMSRTADSASATVCATITPFPAARPSAFTTIEPDACGDSSAPNHFGEYGGRRGWNPVFLEELLGEDLGASSRAPSRLGP